MTLAILLLAAAKTQSDPLARYAAFSAAHPNLKFDFSIKINGQAGPTGSILIQRPKRVLYKAQFQSQNLSISDSEAGYMEIERSTKMYDELPVPAELYFGPTEVNGFLSGVAPQIVLYPDLKGFFNVKAEIADPDPNEIHEKMTTPMGTVEIWTKFDDQGRLASMRRLNSGLGGKHDLQWEFSNYSYPTNLTLASFATPAPLGFTPRTVPRLNFPLQKHSVAPVDGWMGPSGKPANFLVLSGGKPFLLAVTSANSVPCQSFMAYVRKTKSPMPIFVVGPGGYRDPDGTRMAKLAVPATPMVYQIGADGKVTKLWMGFDAAHPDRFAQEMETDKISP